MPTTTIRLFFGDRRLDYELLRAAAYEAYGAAAIGECLAAAEQVREGDPGSWVAAWSQLASRVEGQARAAATAGHRDSAREAYLRASNYHRAASTFAPPGEPRRRELWRRSREAFRAAGALDEPPAEVLAIPHQGRTLPGYLFPARTEAPGPHPLMVVVGGFEGAEECSLLGGAWEANRRGIHVLTFDGPGQPGALHQDRGLVFAATAEDAVRAALDAALDREDVDPARVAVAGWGLGGHAAARAAATDPRVTACVANPPITDLRRWLVAQWAGLAGDLADTVLALAPDAFVDAAVRWAGLSDPVYRAASEEAMWAFGQPSPAELLERLGAFQLRGLERRIAAPTLVLVSEGDGAEAMDQARAFHAGLRGPKDLRVLTRADGADAHGGRNNLPLVHQLVLDWLSSTWAEPSPVAGPDAEPQRGPQPQPQPRPRRAPAAAQEE